MSLSIRTVASKKSLNKVLQSKNILTEFTQPVYLNGNLNIRNNLSVGGDEQIGGNLSINGNLTVNNLTVNNNEQINGNLITNGTILANIFFPGQIINTSMLSNSDLGQNSNVTIAPNATTNIFTITYTPKYSTSYLIIEYQSTYSLDGSGDDDAYAYLKVNGNRISQTYQRWVNALGGGGRSGVLFPLIGRYTNENTSSKVIAVDLYNHTIGDPITVKSDISTWLKITEIGR
jgi:hypothetical protein